MLDSAPGLVAVVVVVAAGCDVDVVVVVVVDVDVVVVAFEECCEVEKEPKLASRHLLTSSRMMSTGQELLAA